MILHIPSPNLMWSPQWSRALHERRPCVSPGTYWMFQKRQMTCTPFTRQLRDIIPSPSEGVPLPLPSWTHWGTSYGIYDMKSDLFGERWLMQPESISQLFGSVGSPLALRVRGSVLTMYTSGSVVTCLVVTCSVVTCAPVSVHSLFFFSLYACFSAWEVVHFWCRCPTGLLREPGRVVPPP